MSWYREGTINLTNGSADVTGVGTAFKSEVRFSDILLVNGVLSEIVRVDSDTAMKLASPWTDATQTGVSFAVIRNLTNASNYDLMKKIDEFLTDRQRSMDEFVEWINGLPGTGPKGDGTFPLTDRYGVTIYAKSPKQMEADTLALTNRQSDLISQTETTLASAQSKLTALGNQEAWANQILGYKNAAAASATKASQWAENGENVAVETGKYSAKHHAIKAAASATAASSSATAAATSKTGADAAKTAAESAKTAAQLSETNAAASATAAKTSETNAAGSASGAATSASQAATSKAGADAAKTAAEAAKAAAQTSEANAAASATSAASSASASLSSSNTAKDWAEKTSGAVTGTQYSAKYHAQLAQTARADVETRQSDIITRQSDVQTRQSDVISRQSNVVSLESSATSSKNAAATSATTATTKATEAANSAAAASTSATNASASELKAGKWAEEVENTPVETGKYSAKHHALKAAASATAASTSAANAAASATTATTKASEASTSAANAAASASTATTKATEASTSATTAGVKAAEASTSATSAAASSTKASQWAETAENVAVETGKYSAKHHAIKAAASATSASTSASSASTSASTATTKAGEAATSATNAANSAATATTKASEAATSATNAANANTAAQSAKTAAEAARDEALIAASSLTGTLSELGSVDLSSGAYPTTPTSAGFWKVTVGGTVGGVDYGVGDTLVYSKNLNQFYKIDNTESVSSVNGKTGVVSLNAADVGALASGGTAAAATKLATARTLSVTGDGTGSANFDGSANAAITLTLANSGVTAGTYSKVTVDAKGRVTAGAALVAADIPTLNQSTTGNAATATKLATARTLSITGDGTGSANFDGSANAAITLTLGSTGVVAGTYTKLTVNGKGLVTGGEALLASDIPTLNQDTTGNAATATALQTARTINGVPFNGTTNITIVDATKEPAFAAGTTAQYRRGDKTWQDLATAVRAVVMTGLSTATSTAVAATDSILAAIGKLQAQIASLGSSKLDATATAAAATKLATARLINGVNFDGSANITVEDGSKLPLAGGTITGPTTLIDSVKLQFGSGADLALWHNGTHSYIDQNGTGNLYIRNNVTGGTILFYADNTGGTSQLVAQLGVGTDNAAYLYAGGATKLYTTAAGVSVTGTLTASSNITAYSDVRLKANIEIIPDALAKVLTLRGVTYDRVDCDNERQTGLIAQEVQAVLPEAVRDDGEHLSVAYGNVVGLLVQAIKELNEKVDQLSGELDGLRRAA